MEDHCLWMVDQYRTLDQPTLYNNNNLHIYPSLHWLIIVYGRSLFMDGYSIKKNFIVIFNSFPISKIIFKIEKKYISLKEQ
jgi:hypothetical protein